MGAFKRTGLPARVARLREFCVGTWITGSRPASPPRNVTVCEEKPPSAVLSRNYWLLQAGFLPPAKARPVFSRLDACPPFSFSSYRCHSSQRPRSRSQSERVLTGTAGRGISATAVCPRRRHKRR